MEDRFPFAFVKMNDFGLRNIQHALAGPARAETNVDVLVLIEVPLVEGADLVEQFAADDHAGAVHPVDFAKLGMVPVFERVILDVAAVREDLAQERSLDQDVER